MPQLNTLPCQDIRDLLEFLWLVCWEGGIFEIFLDVFIDPKILHVACHNLSQIDVTKTFRPV